MLNVSFERCFQNSPFTREHKNHTQKAFTRIQFYILIKYGFKVWNLDTFNKNKINGMFYFGHARFPYKTLNFYKSHFPHLYSHLS